MSFPNPIKTRQRLFSWPSPRRNKTYELTEKVENKPTTACQFAQWSLSANLQPDRTNPKQRFLIHMSGPNFNFSQCAWNTYNLIRRMPERSRTSKRNHQACLKPTLNSSPTATNRSAADFQRANIISQALLNKPRRRTVLITITRYLPAAVEQDGLNK